MRFPEILPGHRVLEIGASILSDVIRRRFACEMHTLYHELEPEWPARFAEAGIIGHPVELMRDEMPVPDNSFDLILFNEVMEHFCISPEPVMQQIISKLKPDGLLLFSVPNFATSEKRVQSIMGKNPQDPMDPRFVYYAHHREPVMAECIDIVNRCGGIVVDYEWSDHDCAPDWGSTLWHCLRNLRHGKLHRIIHQIIPSTRRSLILRVVRDTTRQPPKAVLPLRETREFIGPEPAV
jgi:SAM-dependent methyltransferase